MSDLALCKNLTVVLGKHFLHAKKFDVPDAINNLRYYAGWADKHHGQTIEVRQNQLSWTVDVKLNSFRPTHEAKLAYTRHEPLGVCVCSIPLPV